MFSLAQSEKIFMTYFDVLTYINVKLVSHSFIDSFIFAECESSLRR